jgi:hypothetical protein
MAFTVSSLTNYVDQSSTELIAAAQFKSETAAMANIQTGVKSSAALQLLATDATMLDGSSCGFSGTDGATFTQREITAKSIKFEFTVCPKTLETKWTQLLLKAGQNYTEADIPAMIIDEYIKVINKKLELADWQGDIDNGGTNLNRYDGLINVIVNSAGLLTATTSTWNSTNARTIIKNVIATIPAALKGDSQVVLFMGYDMAETYRQALMDANLYHVAAGSDMNALMAEGSVHKIVPVHGLDSQSRIFAMKPSNIYLGVDMQGEEEQARMWVDGSDNETVKMRVSARRGWQVAYPSEIVSYHDSTLVS